MNSGENVEMIILAPQSELHAEGEVWEVFDLRTVMREENHFKLVVDEFVDEGVYFLFDQHQRLPRDLPQNLGGVKCIMIDPARREEFETGQNAERLLEFRRRGGYVYYPQVRQWYLGPLDRIRQHSLRAIVTAGLTRHSPKMIERLQSFDDLRLLDWWRERIPEQAQLYRDGAWGDPAAFHFYWPVYEAMDFFNDPALMGPVWDAMLHALETHPEHGVSCGARFVLKLYERTSKQWLLDLIKAKYDNLPYWRVDGVSINQDLKVPERTDPDDPPPMVRENAWMWAEMPCYMADSMGYLSKITGDPRYAEEAMRQLLTAHKWCFNKDTQLWHHIGRPTGPDLGAAPWGRGNGWMLYGFRGLLEDLPIDHPQRPGLVAALAEALEGFLRWQAPSGLWRTVIDADEAESRQDSCATWMICSVYGRAYWKGWLRDERIPEMLEKAWKGLKTKIWRGLPVAHCGGTSYQQSRQGYLARPHHRFLGYATMLTLIELERVRRCRAE